MPQRLARQDKHSSLLQTIVNYSRKMFYEIGPWFVVVSLVHYRRYSNQFLNKEIKLMAEIS
jgi:hypothetical protein